LREKSSIKGERGAKITDSRGAFAHDGHGHVFIG
jgi:hypothetical protein